MVIYTLYDIPGYILLHNSVLRVSRAWAGVEVLCGRLAAFCPSEIRVPSVEVIEFQVASF